MMFQVNSSVNPENKRASGHCLSAAAVEGKKQMERASMRRGKDEDEN
jgi:hypothetical protein